MAKYLLSVLQVAHVQCSLPRLTILRGKKVLLKDLHVLFVLQLDLRKGSGRNLVC